MKSAIASFLILIALTVGAYVLSLEQEKVLVPIYYKLEEINTDEADLDEKRSMLDECIKSYTENGFIIKLAIPNDEYDHFHIMLEQARVYLDEENNAQFSACIKESRICLSSLLGYSDVTLDNIL